MDFANCAECGKIFAKVDSDLCPDCRKTLDEDFRKVREYSFAHPGAKAEEITEATGVPGHRLVQILKEGKLRVVNQGQVVCARCGTPILRGTFCRSCELDMKDRAGSKAAKPSPPPRRR